MATSSEAAFAPVLQAMATLQSSAERPQKEAAHDFLDKFQKSAEAWTTTHDILQSQTAPLEGKLFAATTLKGKIVYDLHQLPPESLIPLRNSIINLLVTYRQGPGTRPIRTQLHVCLAGLAVQMLDWKDVLDFVVAAFGTDPANITCLLEFLKVLPEEVNEAGKYNLSDNDLDQRVWELLDNSAAKVLTLLVGFAQTLPNASSSPELIQCLTSWAREISAAPIVRTPLVDLIFSALDSDAAFEAATDGICSLVAETKDVDECLDSIKALYPRIMALRPKLAEAAESDPDSFRGYTRIFAEAGEAWTVLIARLPTEFRELVEAIAEVCARDKEKEVISITFNFWYELKNYLQLEKYMEARMTLADIYQTLVEIVIRHLRYPVPESGDESELFDGDKALEENFKEFRHSIGDVLKDCCEVLGPQECLGKAFAHVQAWIAKYANSGQQTTTVNNWQELEAALFSMRAMGRCIPDDEKLVIPQIMTLLIQLPEHEKVRYAATLVLGRYTRWTAKNPEYLEAELNYITSGFQHQSSDVERAAAQALRFFCEDCAPLLLNHLKTLHSFYEQISPNLPSGSLHEVTEGVAHVVAALPLDQIYDSLKMFCDPIVERLKAKAATAGDDEEALLAVADQVRVLTHFVQFVAPHVEPNEDNPMIRYWASVFDVMASILQRYITCVPICERISRFFRFLVVSYRTGTAPLLTKLAPLLIQAFQQSHEGCFLWVSAAVIREFGDEQTVGEATVLATFDFLQQQCAAMLQVLQEKEPRQISDLIEDFFRLLSDALMFHSTRIISNLPFLDLLFTAAQSSLAQQKTESLIAVLRFLRDLLGFGFEDPPFTSEPGSKNPELIRTRIRQVIDVKGEQLAARILGGLMTDFPRDCIPDSSGVLMRLAELEGKEFAEWMKRTMALLPEGSLGRGEVERFLKEVEGAVTGNNWISLRYALQDFTNRYRRKNIAPRAKISGERD